METNKTLEDLRRAARPLRGTARDYDDIVETAQDKDLVLLGEASHGTHEFYAARAYMTRRLIEEFGYDGVAVEADWPDAYRINRYVSGVAADSSEFEALGEFHRFPRWMWRNREVAQFIRWLHDRNQNHPPHQRAGFFGLDLYSLHSSMLAVIDYLEDVDADAARQAKSAYTCFDQYGEEPQVYGQAVYLGLGSDCEEEVVEQLARLREKRFRYMKRDGLVAEDEQFCAEQNARVAANAERYYREMYRGSVSSWNLRDSHMMQTLDSILAHLKRHKDRPRLVVWAHNSHLGDARYTSMGRRGEHNLGQLAKERFGQRALSVGFTTYDGTVIAASNWDGPSERKTVLSARPDSYEALLHDVGLTAFSLDTSRVPGLEAPCLERAIGVIYRPETELASHYFQASLSRQFDHVVHFDRSRCLEPLDPVGAVRQHREPETYPFGL